MAASESLAVNGDLIHLGFFIQRSNPLNPCLETVLEGERLERRKQASQGVVRRDTVGKFEMLSQPRLIIVSPNANCLRAISPGNDRNDTNDKQIAEDMESIDMRSRVLQLVKTGEDRINIIELDIGVLRSIGKQVEAFTLANVIAEV